MAFSVMHLVQMASAMFDRGGRVFFAYRGEIFLSVIFRSSSRVSRLEQALRGKKTGDRLKFVTQLATLRSMRLALESFIAYPASVGCEALCRKHKPRLSKEGGVFAFWWGFIA